MTGHDDWRLTAWALGDADALDPAERAEIEALVAANPAARATVEEIRATAAHVEADLAAETAPRLDPSQRAAILAAAPPGNPAPAAIRSLWRSWIPFSAAAAAAALLALGTVATSGGARSVDSANARDRELRLDKIADAVGWRPDSREAQGHQWTSPDRIPGAATGRPEREETMPVDDVIYGSPASPRGRAVGGLVFEDGDGVVRGYSRTIEFAGELLPEVFGNDFFSDPQASASAEAYDSVIENDFLRPADHPLSTFSIDVDTASYANVRRMLVAGQRPPPGAVRIEELVNYFPYAYAPPSGNDPFAVHLEVAACPWSLEHRLVRIGLKGREVAKADRPSGNLVFLLDVSGSMDQPNKLPLVQASMELLLGELSGRDKVAIVVYAGASGLVLPPTSCDRRADIVAAIETLQAGGSTNGAAGIELAYQTAKEAFVPGGTNRVILCTDGDFNVGVTSQDELVRLVETKAKDGIFLSVLGFGMGNLKDSTLEKLADKGNGNYGYIDDEKEARKSLVEQAGGTLVTIAKDVKIQVEFNPAQVAAYRLIGYENRVLAAQDFNDDKKDAGEIGAGHTVTALYEVVPAGKPVQTPSVDPLRYQTGSSLTGDAASGETLTVKLRWKQPDGDVSTKAETTLKDFGASYDKASPDFKFAASVAAFGMLLRNSAYKGTTNAEGIVELANEGVGDDPGGYRREFVTLVQKANAVSTPK